MLLRKELHKELRTKSLQERIFPAKALAEYSGKELTIALLGLLAAGTVLVALITAPNLALLFKHFGATSRKEQYRLYRKLTYLERAGYVHKSGAYFVPTGKGATLLQKSVLKAKASVSKRAWDGKWHLVLFDLPATHARSRQDMRRFLTDIGYVHYQHSVFVHKFNFQSEVEKFCALYGVRPYVNFITATNFDNAPQVEKEFVRLQKAIPRSHM